MPLVVIFLLRNKQYYRLRYIGLLQFLIRRMYCRWGIDSFASSYFDEWVFWLGNKYSFQKVLSKDQNLKDTQIRGESLIVLPFCVVVSLRLVGWLIEWTWDQFIDLVVNSNDGSIQLRFFHGWSCQGLTKFHVHVVITMLDKWGRLWRSKLRSMNAWTIHQSGAARELQFGRAQPTIATPVYVWLHQTVIKCWGFLVNCYWGSLSIWWLPLLSQLLSSLIQPLYEMNGCQTHLSATPSPATSDVQLPQTEIENRESSLCQ